MKREPIHLIVTLSILISLLGALPSQAQRRRPRSQIKKSQVVLSQTVSKDCISEGETEGCSIDLSTAEPETGIPNSNVRCSDCIIFGKAIHHPAPCYPQAAKAENISGEVQVKIVVDEEGKVIWARAINGHPMLHEAATKAACRTRFTPSTLIGRKTRVKAVGVMTYNFKLS